MFNQSILGDFKVHPTHSHCTSTFSSDSQGSGEVLLHESLGKRRWTQSIINTRQSLLTPMTGLDNKHRGNNDSFAAAVSGRSLHRCASAVRRQRQLALSRGNIWFRHVLGWGFKLLFWVGKRAHTHHIMLLLFSFNAQRYLRRFYGLPAGLQGRQRMSGAIQTKIKEMQQFFKLKVTRSEKQLFIL